MFDRYAIYFTASGALAELGAAWLGWDIARGCPVPHPDAVALDLETLTEKPRRYGFHATIKPPFALAEGVTEAGLINQLAQVCRGLHAVALPRLDVTALGRFLALTPVGDSAELNDLAARVVSTLDPFRAPMSVDELARRSLGHLKPTQLANLKQWGYPYVMDEFRFHMTLTDRMPKADLAQARDVAASYFALSIKQTQIIDSLTLVGQRADGYFVEVTQCALNSVKAQKKI